MTRKNLFYRIIENMYLKLPDNLAYFDDMTGVKNRQYYNRVMKSKYLNQELYVYYIDIDHIKETNDTLGHAAGSLRIKNAAKELLKTKGLIEIARLGGDEFIAISREYIDITLADASVGVQRKEKWEDLSSCVHKADESMYRQKESHHHKTNTDERKNNE